MAPYDQKQCDKTISPTKHRSANARQIQRRLGSSRRGAYGAVSRQGASHALVSYAAEAQRRPHPGGAGSQSFPGHRIDIQGRPRSRLYGDRFLKRGWRCWRSTRSGGHSKAPMIGLTFSMEKWRCGGGKPAASTGSRSGRDRSGANRMLRHEFRVNLFLGTYPHGHSSLCARVRTFAAMSVCTRPG